MTGRLDCNDRPSQLAQSESEGMVSMFVGAHVSIRGGMDRAIDRERDLGGTTGQSFTRSPVVWEPPDISRVEQETFREKLSSIAGPWMIHSSYLVNLATPKESLREQSIQSLQTDIEIARDLGVAFVTVHLGAHTGSGRDKGLQNVASAIDALDIPRDVTLLLETDAGSGTKLGDKFEDFSRVLSQTHHECGVCFDTAHVFAAGYDLSSPRGVAETFEAFDRVIGLERLLAVHLNDSKHDCGTNKDQHAHIGEGHIGNDGIQAVINNPVVESVPVILETPTENGKSFEWNMNRVAELRTVG